MSQVFSGDSVNAAAAVTIPTSGEVIVAQGNFVNPPFQNAKAMVIGSVSFIVGSGTTTAQIRLRRNPTAENAQVGTSGAVNVTAGNIVSVTVQTADPIPDGRPVQYALTVTAAGATGTGSLQVANVSTILISG